MRTNMCLYAFRRALLINPSHPNTLYNLAVMLDTRLQRKPDAEVFYRRCIDAEPKHAFALYNLAVLLEEKLNDVMVHAGKNMHGDDGSVVDGVEVVSIPGLQAQKEEVYIYIYLYAYAK